MTADVLDALRRANAPDPTLFQRDGVIVRVAATEDGRHRIEAVTESALRGRVARCCDCVTVGATGGGPVHVSPPDHLVRDVLALPGGWGFPPLDGVTGVPVLRPDGTVLDRAGYDPATRLVYARDPGLVVPAIPERPTEAEVAAAVALLHEAIGDFPFADPASRANALALLITPVLRPAVDGPVPMAVVDAPTPGTGKGLLIDTVARVATGAPAAVMTAPAGGAEWKKSITAVLIDGPTMVLIDNVEEPLGSPHLASALTAATWTDRELGRSRIVRLPQRAVWVADGNNVALAGDLPRRCYWVRMDPRLARPWQGRAFRHPDLPAWVDANRGALVGAVLTLCRAWWSAGRPAHAGPVIGGFDGWCRTAGGVLAFAGVRGFLSNLAELYALNDEESGAWAAFLAALHDRFGGKPVTAGAMDAAIRDSTVLREALPEALARSLAETPATFAHGLGHALRKRAGRRHGEANLYVERGGDDAHAKVARWSVRKAGSAGSCGESDNLREGDIGKQTEAVLHPEPGTVHGDSPPLPALPADFDLDELPPTPKRDGP